MTEKKETSLRAIGLALIAAGAALAANDPITGAVIVVVGLGVYVTGHTTEK